MITTSKLNNSIAFSCAIFWGREYEPRAGDRGSQRPDLDGSLIQKKKLKSYKKRLIVTLLSWIHYWSLKEN